MISNMADIILYIKIKTASLLIIVVELFSV